MTPLRNEMIAAMRQRGYSERTHRSYLGAVEALAKYYKRSSDLLQIEDLQSYFDYLVQERDLSGATCRLRLNGIRFLYLQVLQWPTFDVKVIIPKKPQCIPELLTRSEVQRLIGTLGNLKHRTLLLTGYGCGLRVSELVGIKVRDIDGERQLLRVDCGKGAKDRTVILSVGLLDTLRQYWNLYHPTLWLFPNSDPRKHIQVQTAQRIYTRAKTNAGIEKVGGIHALRHAYTTHQLEAGMPVHQLQHALGHSSVRTTMRYGHWVHSNVKGREAVADLVSKLGECDECDS